jgi:hypothetical protein
MDGRASDFDDWARGSVVSISLLGRISVVICGLFLSLHFPGDGGCIMGLSYLGGKGGGVCVNEWVDGWMGGCLGCWTGFKGCCVCVLLWMERVPHP